MHSPRGAAALQRVEPAGGLLQTGTAACWLTVRRATGTMTLVFVRQVRSELAAMELGLLSAPARERQGEQVAALTTDSVQQQCIDAHVESQRCRR